MLINVSRRLIFKYNDNIFQAVMAEWLRRWTRNPMGSPRAGSNPARSDLFLQSRKANEELRILNKYFKNSFHAGYMLLACRKGSLTLKFGSLQIVFDNHHLRHNFDIQNINSVRNSISLQNIIIVYQRIKKSEKVKDILHVQGYKKDKRSSVASCDGRVVKALDLKSNGVSPRRFEPCSQRSNFCRLKIVMTKSENQHALWYRKYRETSVQATVSKHNK